MTTITGTFTSCGATNPFALSFTCSGPNCADFEGFADVPCATAGGALSCTNGVTCAGPSNYTSSFSFTQEEFVVAQTQQVTLLNCGEFTVTSDGTTGGTALQITDDITCGLAANTTSSSVPSHSSTSTTSTISTSGVSNTTTTAKTTSGYHNSTSISTGSTVSLPPATSLKSTTTSSLPGGTSSKGSTSSVSTGTASAKTSSTSSQPGGTSSKTGTSVQTGTAPSGSIGTTSTKASSTSSQPGATSSKSGTSVQTGSTPPSSIGVTSSKASSTSSQSGGASSKSGTSVQTGAAPSFSTGKTSNKASSTSSQPSGTPLASGTSAKTSSASSSIRVQPSSGASTSSKTTSSAGSTVQAGITSTLPGGTTSTKPSTTTSLSSPTLSIVSSKSSDISSSLAVGPSSGSGTSAHSISTQAGSSSSTTAGIHSATVTPLLVSTSHLSTLSTGHTNTTSPVPTIAVGAASYRRPFRPAFLFVFLLVISFLIQGTVALRHEPEPSDRPVKKSCAVNKNQADEITSTLVPYEYPNDHDFLRRDPFPLNLPTLTTREISKRGELPPYASFAADVGEYIASKLTNGNGPLFAQTLLGEVTETLCSHFVGGAITSFLIGDAVEDCIAGVYTLAAAQPEFELLAIFYASVLCNAAVNVLIPEIGDLTDSICKGPDSEPCSDDLLTDPNNCGECMNVCASGVCANGACSEVACTGETCATFGPCGPGGTCVCATTAENTGFCCDGSTLCADLVGCETSLNCGAGEICAVGSCCGVNVCVGATICGGAGVSRRSPELMGREYVNATGPTFAGFGIVWSD